MSRTMGWERKAERFRLPSADNRRRELEKTWRSRVEAAREEYHLAKEEYRKILEANLDRLPRDLNSAWLDACHAEDKALTECARVLRAFTHLILHGTIPKESSGGQQGQDGG